MIKNKERKGEIILKKIKKKTKRKKKKKNLSIKKVRGLS